MLARSSVRETVADQEAVEIGGESERAAAFRRLADSRLYENYKLANAILGDPEGSQDAVHDAVIAAWRYWPTLRDQSKFDAWFSRIVVNTCRNRLSKAGRRRTTDIAERSDAAVHDPSPQVHDREQLERGLVQLKPDDRVLLALRYSRDLTLEDIAELLDVPVGTVKSRLNRAHQRLRAALDAAERKERTR
jgi:RNA polymerase sigma-70 factor (ECF subfamily)